VTNIDFSRPIHHLDGSEIPDLDGDKTQPLTLKLCAIRSLTGALKNDSNDSGVKRFERGALAYEIHKSDSLNLSVEQISMIKERIGQAYPAVIVYRAWEMLDPSGSS
jgi:hypothetical protein